MAGTRTVPQESARAGRGTGTRPSTRRRFLTVSGAALAAGAGRLAPAASAPAGGAAGAAGGGGRAGRRRQPARAGQRGARDRQEPPARPTGRSRPRWC